MNAIPHTVVIPANAGIHCVGRRFVVQGPGHRHQWIPAFAGMTGFRRAVKLAANQTGA